MSKPNDIENRFIASPYIIQDNPFEEYLLISLTQFDSLLERIEKLEKRVFPFEGDEKKCPY